MSAFALLLIAILESKQAARTKILTILRKNAKARPVRWKVHMVLELAHTYLKNFCFNISYLL